MSALDVAGVVTRAAIDATLGGQLIEIAGDPITMTKLVRALQDARGWHGSPRHLPRPLLRVLSVVARPLSPAFARQNQTALAMDSGTLTVHASGAGPLELPRQTVPDVLARLTPS